LPPRVFLAPLVLFVLAVGALALLDATGHAERIALATMDDFVEYWSAGKLNLEGRCPYYPYADMIETQRLAGRVPEDRGLMRGDARTGEDMPLIMFNPPPALTFVMPLGLMPFRIARLAWLFLHLALILWSTTALWRLYGGPDNWRVIAWVLALTFYPTLEVLKMGQIAPLMLAGTVGYLVFIERRADFWAGASGSLLVLKPHLFYLFWPAVFLWALWYGRWRVLLGIAVALAVTTALPLVFNPHVLSQYRELATNHSPIEAMTPTIGAVLRYVLARLEGPTHDMMRYFWLQFPAAVVGGLWFLWHAWRKRGDWDWRQQLPLLLVVSLATTPYGAWPFDMVIALAALLPLTAWCVQLEDWRVTLVWLVIDGVALLQNQTGGANICFVWMPFVLLAGWLLLARKP
jgi:hypothetical protein